MKKFSLSLVAVLAMSTFAMAGGDIAPVEEPVVVVEEPVVSDAGFYLGLAYGWTEGETEYVGGSDSQNYGSIMIDAGYKFNPYIAIEGRYWFGLSSSNALGWHSGVSSDTTIDSYGIYVKPMYPVTDAFDIYALLGYGGTDISHDLDGGGSLSTDASGFSWGLGAEYGFTDNVSMFIDYTDIINGENVSLLGNSLDLSVYNVNVGVNYKF